VGILTDIFYFIPFHSFSFRTSYFKYKFLMSFLPLLSTSCFFLLRSTFCLFRQVTGIHDVYNNISMGTHTWRILTISWCGDVRGTRGGGKRAHTKHRQNFLARHVTMPVEPHNLTFRLLFSTCRLLTPRDSTIMSCEL